MFLQPQTVFRRAQQILVGYWTSLSLRAHTVVAGYNGPVGVGMCTHHRITAGTVHFGQIVGQATHARIAGEVVHK